LFFHRTRLRCFAEQLVTLETVRQKLFGWCAPHTDLESRETGKPFRIPRASGGNSRVEEAGGHMARP